MWKLYEKQKQKQKKKKKKHFGTMKDFPSDHLISRSASLLFCHR